MKTAASTELTKHLLSHTSPTSSITPFHLRSMELHPKLSILVLSCLECHAPAMATSASPVHFDSKISPIMTGRSSIPDPTVAVRGLSG